MLYEVCIIKINPKKEVFSMAKEQIAVAELVLNMILGKTGGTRVDYFPQKPDFPFDAVYEQAFVRATPENQESPLICLLLFFGNWMLPKIRKCIILWHCVMAR